MSRGLSLLALVASAMALSWLLLSTEQHASPNRSPADAVPSWEPRPTDVADPTTGLLATTAVPPLPPAAATTVPPLQRDVGRPLSTLPPTTDHRGAEAVTPTTGHARWIPRSPAPSTLAPSVVCRGSLECVWNDARQGFVPGGRGSIAGNPPATRAASSAPKLRTGDAPELPFFIAGAMDRHRLAKLSLELLRTVDCPVDELVLHVNNPVLGRGLNGSEPLGDAVALGGWLRKDFDAVVAAAKRVARTVHIIVGWGAYSDSCAGQWNTALDVFMRESTADWFVLSAVDVTFSTGGLAALVQHVNDTVARQVPPSGFLWHPHYNRRGSKAHVPTWNVIIANRVTLASAGRFDETFFPAYHEDFDYRARLSAADIHESRVPWKVMRAFHPVESATRTDVRTIRQCAIDCVARTINLGHKNSKQCKSAVERSAATVVDVRRRQLDALDVHPIDESLRGLVRQILSQAEPVFSKLCHPCVEPSGPRAWKPLDAPSWSRTPSSPQCPTVKQSLENDGLLPS